MISSRSTSSAPRRLVATLATATLVLAACGGDDPDELVDDATAAVDDVDADSAEEAVEDAADDVDAEADDAAESAETQSAELAQVLRDNGLSSVASAVEVIDFTELVDAPEFTFFAPNDEAFASLSADELADLLADPTMVADVLRNHTIAATVPSGDLSDGMEVETQAGETLVVGIDGETVMIGDATVVQADIDVNDGVVHVVDRLIMP